MSTADYLKEIMFNRFGNVTFAETMGGTTIIESTMTPSSETISTRVYPEGRVLFFINDERLPLTRDQFEALIVVTPVPR